MATAVVSSLSLKSSPFSAEKSAVKGLPSLARTARFCVEASSVKKIKTDKSYGVNYNMYLRDDLDAFGRKGRGKCVYQFVDKYSANVDGYNPIYNEDEWSPTGDVYVGGTTGLDIWAVTLVRVLGVGALLVYNVGVLGVGALLVYNTSALAQ